MRRYLAVSLILSAVFGAQQVAAEPVTRAQPAAGSVIARKSGEEVRFVDVSDWRFVDLRQDVVAGDYLRTNATGNLAVLFSDRTQMRLGRNTTLLVKNVGPSTDAAFALESGTIWARAERGGPGLTVETPAAAAAIRGTDWTMTVESNGRTSLTVLEGKVELANQFGAVTVSQGEGAVANIGSAPTKIVNVNPDDREQMLFFLSLRNSFNMLPASPLSSPDMRKARGEITAKAPSARSGEDWLTLAEVNLNYEGREAAREAAAQARQFRLTRAQTARLDLIEAMIAGAEKRYDEAAHLFEQARQNLDPRRRAMATYGGYYARALADPNRTEAPPKPKADGPYAAMAEALTVAFLVDFKASIAVLKRAEQRYPENPSLPAMRAQLAMALDDRQQMEEAIDRSLSLDPDDPNALEARANFRAGFKSDLEGAYADLTRALEIAPGSTTIWNGLGLVQNARGAYRESEAALKQAIALDPQDPVSHINLAVLYLDQDRVVEARAEIDKALEVDPSFDMALLIRGRYYMQTGELEKAREDLLAGTTANPADAQGLLLLGASYYESGEHEPAAQAIENADRLDANDPVVSSFRTAIAIDEYESDEAIRSAQEALRRARARGGDYAPLSASRDQGSTLNDAYRLQGLDAWGRYYGAAVFDPFGAAGYVDQTVSGSPNPFVNDLNYGATVVDPGTNGAGFSSFFQGLMLDPAMISGRSTSATLFRRPFLETSIGGGFTSTSDNTGWTSEAEVQGFVNDPIPWSFYGKLDVQRSGEFREGTDPGFPVPNVRFDLEDKLVAGTGFVTARPTPNDRVVAYVDIRNDEANLNNGLFVFPSPVIIDPGFPFPIVGSTYDRQLENRSANLGLGWSHTFGYKNVVNAAFFASSSRQTSEEAATFAFDFGLPILLPGPGTIDGSSEQSAYIGALNHTYGVGDLTLRYGLEGGTIDSKQTKATSISFPFLPVFNEIETTDTGLTIGRAYMDGLYEVTSALKLEAALFGTYLDGDVNGLGFEQGKLEPRVGAAWAPVEGHWLRAAFMRETAAVNTTTLAPIGIVGLQSNQTPIGLGGYSDTFAARWDAELNGRLFTTLDYQHQELSGLSIDIPGAFDSTDLTEARIDRLAATANVWLGGGFGAFATYAYTDSENKDPTSFGFGEALPYVPEHSARLGVTWVNPANFKVTLAATYIGERSGDVSGDPIDPYWTADTFATWEPFNKRFELELAAYNLFDEKFNVAASVPGWGRSFVGSLKVRF
ncbi:TonB-dependent receptor [Mesorhizobium sp. YR577]|uniref:TonB-dependent receptor domain-containing protein n=1 Tax=Mesorhizobium sp. YR577 TaxID=1884373 RepID=UPI0008F20F7F|nr:TonB-dependent receptor [Mesorhizobium sp. YR577]SFT56880.1 FecR family protein [Mesorhizobium sp. YR577]